MGVKHQNIAQREDQDLGVVRMGADTDGRRVTVERVLALCLDPEKFLSWEVPPTCANPYLSPSGHRLWGANKSFFGVIKSTRWVASVTCKSLDLTAS